MSHLNFPSLPPHHVTGNAGLYLHIPFCKKACVYCNFHFSVSLKNKSDLLRAMLTEIEQQRDYLKNTPISTIYLGGGTPSLLTADEINILFDTIYKFYPVNELKECTIEANPDDLDKNYLKALKNTPITRLSIGVQSFIESDLQYMKRAHTAQQADFCIKAAQDTGFTNLSIDLIYGTPGLTDAGWKSNLSKTKLLEIPHFSAYALTVEDKTALHSAIQKKKSEPVDPEQAAGQFEILAEFAALNGYDHYEISNLALPGKYAVHNTNYWLGMPYLGIGPSAHSFNGNSRKSNISNNALYTSELFSGRPSPGEIEELSTVQHLNEYIMTSIRTMWGCDLMHIGNKWGNEFAAEILKSTERLIERNLLTNEHQVLKLTPKGKLFADKIASDLFF